jgi:hypothetical protein
MSGRLVSLLLLLSASACHSGGPHLSSHDDLAVPSLRDLALASADLFPVNDALASLPDLAGTDLTPQAPLAVAPDGDWELSFAAPPFSFAGHIGAPLSNIATTRGSDGLGSYQETAFDYDDNAPKTGSIRRYDAVPVALFTEIIHSEAANMNPFPTISSYPQLPYHLAYQDVEFAPYSFSVLAPDSPWIFFGGDGATFVLSAATHFNHAALSRDASGTVAAGIDPAVATLPAGFTQRTVLVAERGINAAFARWGDALTTWAQKARPANDATIELRQLGYWTDNGATYYYNYDNAKGYAGTITAVRDSFKQLGIALGYMQLDSWWYPKGPAADWSARGNGIATYSAAPALFPSGLVAFQQSLGLPLVTHARWIDPASPYQSQYKMSNNVIIDSAYWNTIATQLNSAGVITYEQDWMNQQALARSDNLDDEDTFLDDMASAMAGQGIDLQYCMPLPRHYLQTTKYANAISMRVSQDRFEPSKWVSFFYGSRLAAALGVWPWSDVFMSSEEGNLTLATLSGGPVGVGDALGASNGTLLLRAVRSDGVIVKPDAPLVPLDSSILDGARAIDRPMVAATWSDLGGLRASYVFIFAAGSAQGFSFTPAELGYRGRVRLYDFYGGGSSEIEASASFSGTVQNGRAYFVLVPVGASGIAFLGDPGKYASLGKARVAAASDDGRVHASIVFGAGETAVTLHGFASRAPTVTASLGGAVGTSWDGTTQRFTVTVTPVGQAASITIAP